MQQRPHGAVALPGVACDRDRVQEAQLRYELPRHLAEAHILDMQVLHGRQTLQQVLGELLDRVSGQRQQEQVLEAPADAAEEALHD